jgi:hypothetical protein
LARPGRKEAEQVELAARQVQRRAVEPREATLPVQPDPTDRDGVFVARLAIREREVHSRSQLRRGERFGEEIVGSGRDQPAELGMPGVDHHDRGRRAGPQRGKDRGAVGRHGARIHEGQVHAALLERGARRGDRVPALHAVAGLVQYPADARPHARLGDQQDIRWHGADSVLGPASGQGAGTDVRGGHSTGAAPGPTIKTVLNVLERPVNAD